MIRRILFAAALAGVIAAAPPSVASAAAPVSPQAQQRFRQYATRAVDASRITHRNFVGGVNSRLTVVHEMAFENPDDPGGVWETASAEPVDRFWVGGVGAGATQSGTDGYDFSAYGINLGYDWSCGDFTLGVAAAFTLGTITNSEIDTKNKIDAAHFAVYASSDPMEGLFYDANLSYGWTSNRSLSMEVAEGRGSREGRFDTTAYGLGGNIGHSFDLAMAKLTPTFGFQWTRHTQDAYTETAYTVTPNWFAESTTDVVEIPLALRADTSWQLGTGTVLSPELRAAYVIRTGDDETTVTMGEAGGSGYTLTGADGGGNRMRIGAGLKANFTPTIDAFVDYNLEFGSGYRATTFNTGVGVSF